MEKNQARSRLRPKKATLWQRYVHYIFCLLLALGAYLALYLFLNKFYPSQVQNFLFKNSYLPFFLLTFLANFFLFTFLLLDKSFGFVIAFFINLILYFRISDIYFDLSCFLTIFLITLALSSLIFFEKIKQVNKSKK
jgi:ABC-type polysaccharide transport system permease subunit